jgi:signal transduction histidine kinase
MARRVPPDEVPSSDAPPAAAGGDLAERLHESEKLAVLRAIAAGFANELGNPLAGVLGVLQVVARRTREPETRERLVAAHAELARVTQVIRELADFTRLDGEAAVVDVNEALRAALTLARYAHQGAAVTVTFEPDTTIGPLVGSRNHLLQVFLHLAMNAYEAMFDRVGALAVRSRRGDGEIVVVFEDTGPGIAAAAIDRLFEPFFTTKGSTGLGLFVCRRIVAEELGGRIAVDGAPGRGARFTVHLPTGDVAAATRRRRSARHRGSAQ